MATTSRVEPLVVASLIALAATMAGLHAVPHRGIDFGATIALVGAATVAWIVVVRAVVAGRFAPALPGALLLVLALRALAWPLEPQLSDDVFRYVHEGRLLLAGENPYLHAPSDPEVAALRGPEWPRINNPDIPAAYPPVVQLASAAAVSVVDSPAGVKLAFALVDVLTFLLLWRLCRVLGTAPQRALVHGLCPLVALEFAGEGHGDCLAACATVGGLLAARLGRSATSGAALALATASKWLPAVLLPFAARGKGLRPWVSFAVVLAVLWFPFVPWNEPFDVLAGTAEYAARWRHNDTVHGLLRLGAESLVERGIVGSIAAQRAVKLLLLMAGLALLGWLWQRRANAERAAFWFFAFFFACAPTVHPWYVAGLFVPWLALRPNVWLLAFCGTILLADLPVRDWLTLGVWRENLWVKVLIWTPFYVGVGAELLRERRACDRRSLTGASDGW